MPPEGQPQRPVATTDRPTADGSIIDGKTGMPVEAGALVKPVPTEHARAQLARLGGSVSGLDAATVATAFVASGYFKDAKNQAAAVVKIIAGREMGLGDFEAMQGLYLSEKSGRLGMMAEMLAAKIKGSGRYDYKIIQLDEKGCILRGFRKVDGKWEQLEPDVAFMLEDAARAKKTGSDNPYGQYPRNMFFSRAIANMKRWLMPDVLGGGGVKVSTTEEIKEDDAALADRRDEPTDRHPDLQARFEKLGWTGGTVEMWLGQHGERPLVEQIAMLDRELGGTKTPPAETIEPASVTAAPAAETKPPVEETPAQGELVTAPPADTDTSKKKRRLIF